MEAGLCQIWACFRFIQLARQKYLGVMGMRCKADVRGSSKTNKSREEENDHDCKDPVGNPGSIPAEDQSPRHFSETTVSSNWELATIIRVM